MVGHVHNEHRALQMIIQIQERGIDDGNASTMAAGGPDRFTPVLRQGAHDQRLRLELGDVVPASHDVQQPIGQPGRIQRSK